MRRKLVAHPLNRRSRKSGFGSAHVVLLLVPTSVFLLILAAWLALRNATSAASNSLVVTSQQQQTSHVTADHQSSAASGIRAQQVEAAEASSNDAIRSVRQEFQSRYGAASDELYKRAVTSFGSLEATADRMLAAASAQRPFVLAFAGYSVTVGRGNHYEQSFPFCLQRVLEPLFSSTLHIGVTVRNSAIGGIPSFPYAFCLEHFLGNDPDVISWDFSMNEGNTASVLESYLRHSQHQLPNRPMLILLDKNKQRKDILKQYTEKGWIRDAISVNMAKDILEPAFFKKAESELAPGFQHWDEFGAPKNCPGRGSWHPKRMEHEFIGWMMAMHMVDALELALTKRDADSNWESAYSQRSRLEASETPQFGAPLKSVPENDQAVTDFLFGHNNNKDGSDEYVMNAMSCRTNFLPATDPSNVLPSIVVSGMSPGITAENIMDPRSDAAYSSGWVLDVSKVERDTKVKVEQCGGLGYVDMKIALYGVPESGTLKLWLPLETEAAHHNDHSHSDGNNNNNAKHWFDDVIICEANEKRSASACHLDQDIQYTVGGTAVEGLKMIRGAAEYLKRQTCVHIGVPPDATIARLSELEVSSEDRERLAGPGTSDDSIGLLLEITAKANVNRNDGACCISHVVWEQH